MTFHLDWLKTGRAPRGTPRRRGPRRRLIVMGLIAGLAVIQAGCQSGPFSKCGGCSSCGFFKRATDRVLHRDGGCGSGAVGGSAVEYGTPSTVVSAPSAAAPIYVPGPASGSVPSAVPVSPDTPTSLEPAPNARPVPLPNGGRATTGSGAKPMGYFARQSPTKTAVRLDSGAPAEAAPASRPRRLPAEPTRSDDDNPLDHLPPLGLPGEVTQERTSPAPSASGPGGTTGDVSLSLAPDASTEADSPAEAATGMARFASVDLRLAGGSLPSAAGLGWLAERGYRTILDLRQSGEVSPAFIADAASRGLRYVALPVKLDRLDPNQLERFSFELAAPEARPLFFFDSDGSRAGALWYIRRVTVDRVDPQLARREAEDIGLKDRVAWESATGYVQRLEAAKSHLAPAHATATEPVPPAPASASSDRTHSPASPTAAAAKTSSLAPQTPDSESFSIPDSLSWRPVAAMLVTGLCLPLAYWTRTAIPDAIARARASLPAPAPRPQALPHESGE